MPYIIALAGTLEPNYTKPVCGQMLPFNGKSAPRGWAFAEGQLLQIAQNPELFAILQSGGQGRPDFSLPNMPKLPGGRRYIIAVNGTFPKPPRR